MVVSQGREIAGFRVIRHLGSGAASEIYAVSDPKSRQVWALKHVIKKRDKDQRFLEQTETEYEVGSALDHPTLRHVERLIKHRQRFRVTSMSLVMELIDAVTLDQIEETAVEGMVDIFRRVAEGLAHMHERGFVHADMKPSNVMVTEDGRPKIIDLGQSCPIGTVKPRIQGTPGYMAPEQAHRREITPRTDIYNFGATMYWMLVREVIPTALPPKGSDDAKSLYGGALDAEQVEPPVPAHEKNPAVPPVLSKLIQECVHVDPLKRPDSMGAVARRLELIGDLLIQSNPATARRNDSLAG